MEGRFRDLVARLRFNAKKELPAKRAELVIAADELERIHEEVSKWTMRAQAAERKAQDYANRLQYKHDLLIRIRMAIGKVDFRTATGELKTWTCELPSELINELDEEVY